MAYNRPGVQVTQKQVTVSPTLIAPDLPAVVIGPAYRVVEISERATDFTHDYGATLGAVSTTINLFSGVAFDTTSLTNIATADSDLIYVDIVGTSASAIGQVLHVNPGNTSVLGLSGNNLTVYKTGLSGITSSPDIWVSGIIKVGWRAMDTSLTGQMLSVESSNEIETLCGKRIPENPAAFGLSIALANAGRATYVATMSGLEDADHDDVLEVVAGQDVYALAPVVMLSAGLAATYAAHADSRSAATEKLERIAFGAISRTFTGVKATDANTISASNLSLGNSRFFSVHPPAAYYATKRHIATVNPTYLDAMNGDLGLKAILDERVQTSAGVTYLKGQEITHAVWSGIASAQSYVQALIPVPGAFWAAAVAGQVAGLPPQQGHTNLPIGGGLDRVKYSNDYFTQSQLNTIAAGGSYIISQTVPSAAPACRHQLSTDMSSIETRELSITKVLDYVSKFIRNGMTPYIGRYNLTDKFLALMSMTLDGMKSSLIRDGVIEDLIVLEMAPAPSEPDTLLLTLEAKVPYPVNYIKITLAF